MKYVVDTIHNGVWITSSTEIPDNTPTVKKKFKKWKRHIVDNGYNADWKCKCGYVCKLDFPPDVCPNCGADMRKENEE